MMEQFKLQSCLERFHKFILKTTNNVLYFNLVTLVQVRFVKFRKIFVDRNG